MISYLDAQPLYAKICKHVVLAAHIIKQGDNVKSITSSSQAKDHLLGLANAIYKFKKLDDYVPDWENNECIKAPCTLMEEVDARIDNARAANARLTTQNR